MIAIAARARARGIGLLVSAAVHAVLLSGVLLLWPSGSYRAVADRGNEPATRPSAAASPRERAEPREFRQGEGSDEPRAQGRTTAPTMLPRTANRIRVLPRSATSGTDSPARQSLLPMALVVESRNTENGILDHLWQSTLFALAVGLLTLAFRRNDARVRFWLWFAVTVKFLVPFAWLQLLGRLLPGSALVPAVAAPAVSFTMAQVGQPFTNGGFGVALPPPASVSVAEWFLPLAFVAWALGFEFVVLMRLRAWRVVRDSVRASSPVQTWTGTLPPQLQVRSSPTVLEPGVVGLWRPILLLPAGIERQLTQEQLEAVIVHEACHVRSLDNLTAAVQMLVEAVFWFHPLVWWVGGRLIQERERACDEHVLRSCRNPRAYADGIVNVCKQYVDARLACVPGVSSSDLRRRIERIMKNETGTEVPRWKRIALAIAAALTLAAPVGLGAMTAPARAFVQRPEPAPSTDAANSAFQAASVKQNLSGDIGLRFDVQAPGRFTATNVNAALLIRFAYDLPEFQVVGGPGWLDSERFDVVATAEGNPSVERKRQMLRRLLADRFGFTAHREARDLPIYALTMVRSDGGLGHRLRRSTTDCDASGSALFPGLRVGSAADASPNSGPPKCGFFGMSPDTDLPAARGGLAFRGLTMDGLARTLVTVVHRSVKDETGLAGYFDGDLDFLAELPPPPPPPGVPNPFTTPFTSVFTVLPEQLGLKLDSRRGPVDVLVVDAVRHPTAD